MTVFDQREVDKAWACPDSEVMMMESVLPKLPLASRDTWREIIRLRKDMVAAGLTVPMSYQERLFALDPYLRLRWEMPWECYVIERVDTGIRAWVTIFRWCHEDGSPKPLSYEAVTEIIAKLQEGDLQRRDPREVLETKRERAAKVQAANWQRGCDQVCEAIDRMSNNQVKEFLAVERALRTGERIRPGGSDAALLNQMYELQRSGAIDTSDIPGPEAAINPYQSPTRRV